MDLANNYEFSKKDAIFFLNSHQDFINTYLRTGRKLNIVQSEDCEGYVYLKPVASKQKIVPDKSNGGSRVTTVPPFTKLATQSKVPKYLVVEEEKK